MYISASARKVLQQSAVVCSNDVGFHIPAGIHVDPCVMGEIEQIARSMRGPVNEASQAVLTALLEFEGIRTLDVPTVIV